jgi:hypothetical protein
MLLAYYSLNYERMLKKRGVSLAEALLPFRKMVGKWRGKCKVGGHSSGEYKARKLHNSSAIKRIKNDRGNNPTAK